jgi:COP9 signalosome complex subunit 4
MADPRLRAWIDQPLHLIYFESRPTHDTDADTSGTAGGLGVKKEEKEVEPVSWTERWDDRIRGVSLQVGALGRNSPAKQTIQGPSADDVRWRLSLRIYKPEVSFPEAVV